MMFQNSNRNQKGEIGEKIIRQRLEAKGYVVYRPVTEAAHAFDMMAIKDKTKAIALDVKTKSARRAFPDTGVDFNHFELYKAFAERHLIDFWIVFVDDLNKRIYGNTLAELELPAPIEHNGRILHYPRNEAAKDGKLIRYWPLVRMLNFGTLPDQVAENLTSLTRSAWREDSAK
jgi:hypothetical protein